MASGPGSDLLIVDGHNALHRMSRYQKQVSRDFATAVKTFICDLELMATQEELSVLVVFDGNPIEAVLSAGPVVVEFSGARSADEIIERMVFSLSKVREVTVATSDYNQQKVISRPGVLVQSVSHLETRVEEALAVPTSHRQSITLEDRLPEEIRRRLEEIRRGRGGQD